MADPRRSSLSWASVALTRPSCIHRGKHLALTLNSRLSSSSASCCDRLVLTCIGSVGSFIRFCHWVELVWRSVPGQVAKLSFRDYFCCNRTRHVLEGAADNGAVHRTVPWGHYHRHLYVKAFFFRRHNPAQVCRLRLPPATHWPACIAHTECGTGLRLAPRPRCVPMLWPASHSQFVFVFHS
jgi:hypothetical protein